MKYLRLKPFACTLGASLALALATSSSAQPTLTPDTPDEAWSGSQIASTGWVDTTSSLFLSWLWVGNEGQQDWVYSLGLESYLYLPVENLGPSGGWAYALDIGAFDAIQIVGPWYESSVFENVLLYFPGEIAPSGAGWVYLWADLSYPLLQELGPWTLDSDPITLTTSDVADPDGDTIAAKYDGALYLPPSYFARQANYDLGSTVAVEVTGDGVKFTNTSTLRNDAKIRLGYENGEGLIDLSALDGLSGTTYLDVLADVDLANSTNGFYIRGKTTTSGSNPDEHPEVIAYARLDRETVNEDILLSTYLTNPAEETYLEITLPQQGSITLKGVFVHMEDTVTGFAGMADQITGGEGAAPEDIYVVSNAAEFAAAHEAIGTSDGPSIIYVTGTISYEDWVEATGNDSREAEFGGNRSNVSILGVGNSALFDGLGLTFSGTNFIVRNVTVRYVLAKDAVQLNNATYVWIDHCTLYNESFEINGDKDKFDELLSAKNNAQNIIVSWNHIYDSHKTILVGSNDTLDAIPDRKMVFHHNWFQNGGSRHPLYRGGHAHIYNNYYQNIENGINVRTNAKILIENNYFEDSTSVIGHYFGGTPGLWDVAGNIFDNTSGGTPTTSTGTVTFESEYDYSLDATADIPSLVTAGAGVGNITIQLPE